MQILDSDDEMESLLVDVRSSHEDVNGKRFSFYDGEPPIASQTSQKQKPPGPARVLTSEESLTLLKEKEKKKQEEKEEQERKRREREEKLQEREEKEG